MAAPGGRPVGTRLQSFERKFTNGFEHHKSRLILFYLPLIPQGSYRLLYRDFTREAVGTRETFSARSVPFAWGQVLRTWLVGLLVVAAFTGGLVALVASKRP